MPRKITVIEFVDSAKKRCDMEFDALISDDEWASLASEGYGILYNVVWETGNEYFEYTAEFVTDGTNVLSEPVDHLSTVALTYFAGGAVGCNPVDLVPIEATERSRVSNLRGQPAYYALVDDKIYLYPTPAAGALLEMRYVPQPPKLALRNVDESEMVIDVVTPDGLEYLVECVAVKALRKAKADPQDIALAISERDKAMERFTATAVSRSISSGHHRVIERNGNLLDGFDGYGLDVASWRRTPPL